MSDPTVAAWACVVAYLAAAGLAGDTLLRHSKPLRRLERLLLLTVPLVLLALGLNKELDLQTTLIARLREGLAGGLIWEHRRGIALGIACVVAPAVAAGLSVLGYRARQDGPAAVGIFSGVALLLLLAIARAVPGSHNAWLQIRLGGAPHGPFELQIKEAVELMLAAVVGLSAWAMRR